MEILLCSSVVLIVLALLVLVYITFQEHLDTLLRKQKCNKKYEAEVLHAFEDLLKDESLVEIKNLLSARPHTNKLPPISLLIRDPQRMHEAKEELEYSLEKYLAIMELILICKSKGFIPEAVFEKYFWQSFVDIQENANLSTHIYRCSCNYLELNKYINGLS